MPLTPSIRSPLARALAVPLAVAVLATASSPVAAQDQSTVLAETQLCADLGRKQPGEPAGAAMADHIAERFAAAGLDVARETFHQPVFDVESVSATVVEPQPLDVAATSFAYGGTGTVQAEVVYVGTGRASDYAGVDATGKIVLVDRDTSFHRSAQLNEVIAHGGAAMLYASAAPDNLVQVGTVRFAQHPPPEILTVTVGADDGAALKDMAEAGELVMRLTVDAERNDATGINVIGTKVGTTHPERIIMVGGHYDSWFDGAVDNCSAIGSMLQMIEEVAAQDLAYTVMFGAWDGEETGLVGSYDWVMRHPDLVEQIVVNQNLEMTSAATQLGDTELDASLVNLVFGTVGPAMNGVIATSMAQTGHVAAPTTAPAIRAIQGGIIPTDLQPFYTAGIQGFSTFSNSAYYHTEEDTTEHIPPGAHERVTEFLTRFLLDVQNVPPEALAVREVPVVEVEMSPVHPTGVPLEVTVTVIDPTGRPVTGVAPRVLINERDHWPVVMQQSEEVGDGVYTTTIDGGLLDEVGEIWATATVDEDLYAAEGYARTELVEGPYLRHAGSDRITTGTAVSAATFASAEAVVLATEATFADALAGAPLAVVEDAPLLLTEPDRLSMATQHEIMRLDASRAVVLGGTAALSEAVVEDLAGLGLVVERVGGAHRYATAAAIAERVGVSDQAVVASGETFPDALSATAVAAARGIPVLLARSSDLPAETAEALSPDVDVTLVGGLSVLGAEVQAALEEVAGEVTRVAGATRYGTSADVARAGLAAGLSLDGVWVATGRGFPDGLVAGAAAGHAGVPLVLIDGLDVDGAPETVGLLREAAADIGTVHVAGGRSAVADEVLEAVFGEG